MKGVIVLESREPLQIPETGTSPRDVRYPLVFLVGPERMVKRSKFLFNGIVDLGLPFCFGFGFGLFPARQIRRKNQGRFGIFVRTTAAPGTPSGAPEEFRLNSSEYRGILLVFGNRTLASPPNAFQVFHPGEHLRVSPSRQPSYYGPAGRLSESLSIVFSALLPPTTDMIRGLDYWHYSNIFIRKSKPTNHKSAQ